jgi:exportin-2 (importin alpha re-exporter)
MESVLQVINGDTYHKDLMFVVLKYLMRLFYNLNYQDLHPLFEDNLDKWMQKLIQVIHIQSKDIRILRAKGEALKSILLFASKYRDDIKPVIENFSQEIWRLCGETKGDSDVVDEIQVIALKYFKHLIVWPDMKPFFAQHLENLLQILILPNVGLNSN